jgi:hypothetical protein
LRDLPHKMSAPLSVALMAPQLKLFMTTLVKSWQRAVERA